MRASGAALAAMTMLVVPCVARAQEHAPIRPEVRVDATSANVQRLELGAGAAIPMGNYVRIALLAGDAAPSFWLITPTISSKLF